MYKLQSLKIKNIISFKDQEYVFQNGKAMLIVGNNVCDAGQKGNGAGKSAFMESISIVLTGSSVRNVKTKELINRQSETAEVELILYNTQSNSYFKIWRKIYSNTKSAEYASWVSADNKDWIDQGQRYSDFHTFNAFVWQTIGISKEDFYNFYFLTSDYKPFLVSPDAQKKDIINRFSGADKVDNAIPAIEADSTTVQAAIALIERELLSNTTRQELLTEQLLAEEEKISDVKQNEVIAAKVNELSNQQSHTYVFNDDLLELDRELAIAKEALVNDTSNETLQEFKDEVEIAELELAGFEFTKDYDAEFGSLTGKRTGVIISIDEKKLALPKVKDKFITEIGDIQNEEIELKDGLLLAQQELATNEKFESEVAKQLHDSITCPKCSHVFNLKDKTFNAADAKAKLPEVQTAITEYKQLIAELTTSINVDIQAKKAAVNDKVVQAGESIRKEIEVLNKQLIDLGQQETSLKAEQQKELQEQRKFTDAITDAKCNLTNKEREVANKLVQLNAAVTDTVTAIERKKLSLLRHEENIASLELELTNLRNKEVDRSTIDSLTKQIETLIEGEAEILARKEVKGTELASINEWAIHFNKFKSHLANKSLGNIESYTNLFLQNMGSNLSIKLEGYKVSNKKIKEAITVLVMRDGFEDGSFGAYSGGERSRMALANTLCMQELINIASPTGGLDFLLVDEVLDQVDLLGIENIITSLQPIGKTVLLISQHTEISNMAEYIITIKKENGISTIQ